MIRCGGAGSMAARGQRISRVRGVSVKRVSGMYRGVRSDLHHFWYLYFEMLPSSKDRVCRGVRGNREVSKEITILDDPGTEDNEMATEDAKLYPTATAPSSVVSVCAPCSLAVCDCLPIRRSAVA